MKQNIAHAIGILLLVWGTITLTINSYNAFHYRLQNATIAALTDRHTFTLKELDVPDFRLIVGQETFRISEDIYPMKQPGQTILGAMIYYPMRLLGINFQNHYMYASQLITMYSSALMTSLASLVIMIVASHIAKNRWIGIFSGLLLVFGTIIWPYAGVTHHDILGMFMICVALGLYYWSRQVGQVKYAFAASVVASLSLFFTMLTLPIPFVLWGLAKDKKILALGTLIGLAPTIIFNLLVFGKPWMVANIAGKVSDTVPLLSITNLLDKLWFYLLNPTTSLWVYSPILLFGLIGILNLKAKDKSLKQLLLLPTLAQVLYVSSIETFGGYQYGPRYLIPIIPFLILGIPLWLRDKHKSFAQIIFGSVAVMSIVLALIGAMQTVMVPIGEGYEPFNLVLKIVAGEMPNFRVWKYGALMMAVGGMILVVDKLRVARIRVKVRK